MLTDLIERDNEERLRVSSRSLEFPDGETRRIETYRLVWRWFDHLIDYEFAPNEADVLRYTLNCSRDENRTLHEALGRVVEYLVVSYEGSSGIDLTDDPLHLLVARQAVARFHERNRSQ